LTYLARLAARQETKTGILHFCFWAYLGSPVLEEQRNPALIGGRAANQAVPNPVFLHSCFLTYLGGHDTAGEIKTEISIFDLALFF
jgi:hypothetical protein